MKIFLLFWGLLSLASISAQTPAASSTPHPAMPKPPAGGLEYLHEVEIGTGNNHPLHAEIALPKTRPAQPMPVVIWIHGGGLKAGSYKGNGAAFLAPYGYVTVSIEYRFISESPWPAQIEDCKLAVRYLRANAAKYGLDPNRIGVMGHSSGAQLASLLGTTEKNVDFEGTGGSPGVSSRVSAVVEMDGPNDATLFPAPAKEAIFGKERANDPEVLKNASPVFCAKAGNPPFLIFHGSEDKSVPIAVSLAFKEALEKVGVPVKMVIVQGGDHGLNAVPGGAPPDPDKEGVHALILDFFEKNLKGGNSPASS